MALIRCMEKKMFNIDIYDNLNFIGNNKFAKLPYKLNADYEITVDYTLPNYIDNRPIIGTDSDAHYLHLSTFSNKYYDSEGTNESNFTPNTLTGRHIYIVNKNNKCYFDDEEVHDYTPTTDNSIDLRVGSRGDLDRFGYFFNGTIHEYKIKSITTGLLIADYKPALLSFNQTKYDFIPSYSGLYDEINDNFIYCGDTVTNNH